MQILSKVHSRNLIEWAKDAGSLGFVCGPTSSTIDLLEILIPTGLFLSASRNRICSALRAAWPEGSSRWCTFAVFIYRRVYDQIAMSVVYPNLPVKCLAFVGITNLAATHQAIEDISVMRSLPNLTILECGDATEVESHRRSLRSGRFIFAAARRNSRLFGLEEPMQFGQARL